MMVGVNKRNPVRPTAAQVIRTNVQKDIEWKITHGDNMASLLWSLAEDATLQPELTFWEQNDVKKLGLCVGHEYKQNAVIS